MVQSRTLDRTFSALSDPTRRDILERLSSGPASISQLADPIGISLPGVMKHVRVLEEANLVTTEKQGRMRACRLGPERMDDATKWMQLQRARWGRRFDRLGMQVEGTPTVAGSTSDEGRKGRMTDATSPEGVVSAHSDAEGIAIVRVFDAPRELVFKAWTEAERFAAWFGEDGSEVPLETISMDARPGGAWSLIMLYGPDRAELRFGGVFREVAAPERVVMTITDQSEGENVDVFIVDLKDLGNGRTEMTFSQRGSNLPADEYSRALRGELIFFDRMARHFSDTLKARHDSD